MPTYTFICKKGSDGWTATRWTEDGLDESFKVEAADDWNLQRELSKQSLAKDPVGAVTSSFNYTSPTTAVAQVIVGGAVFAAAAGGAAPAAAAGGSAGAAPAAEEKKVEEESEEEDMGFSLFD